MPITPTEDVVAPVRRMGHSPLHNPHRNPQGNEDYRGELYKLLGVTQVRWSYTSAEIVLF